VNQPVQARLPKYQSLIYEFPCDDRQKAINKHLDELFLTAMGGGFACISAQTKLSHLLEMSPNDREEAYTDALNGLESEDRD
jgi:hypothetical protein